MFPAQILIESHEKESMIMEKKAEAQTLLIFRELLQHKYCSGDFENIMWNSFPAQILFESHARESMIMQK